MYHWSWNKLIDSDFSIISVHTPSHELLWNGYATSVKTWSTNCIWKSSMSTFEWHFIEILDLEIFFKWCNIVTEILVVLMIHVWTCILYIYTSFYRILLNQKIYFSNCWTMNKNVWLIITCNYDYRNCFIQMMLSKF